MIPHELDCTWWYSACQACPRSWVLPSAPQKINTCKMVSASKELRMQLISHTSETKAGRTVTLDAHMVVQLTEEQHSPEYLGLSC